MIEYVLLRRQLENDVGGYDALPLFLAYLIVYLAQAAMLYFFAGRLFQKRPKAYSFFLVNVAALVYAGGAALGSCVIEFSALTHVAVNAALMLWTALSLHLLYSDSLGCKTVYALLSQFVFTVGDLFVGSAFLRLGSRYWFFAEQISNNGGIFRAVFCAGEKILALTLLIILCGGLARIFVSCGKNEIVALNYAAVILCAFSQLVSLPFFGKFGKYDLTRGEYVFFAALFAALLALALTAVRLFPRLCGAVRKSRWALSGDIKPPEYQSGEPGGHSARELRKLRHDVKNNVVTITALIDSGESAEAKRLLSELGERLTGALGSGGATGVAAIDSTLSAKSALCEERGVALDMRVEPLPETKIPPIDLSSAISNIIDNALEAAAHCTDPVIKLRIFKYKMYLAVICENPIAEKPRISGGKLVTSKENADRHGYGTEIVSEICRQNNGSFRFEYTESSFKASAFLEI